MCGRGGVAGDVTITSQRGCTGSIGKRLVQSQESGLQALRRRVKRKTEKRDALEAENKELRARIDAMEKKAGGQKEPGIPFQEEEDSGDVWGDCMEVEDEAECRRQLDTEKKDAEGAA